MLAAIKIRGMIRANGDLKHAVDVLGLRKKNGCILQPNTPSVKGMMQKLKDFITFGEIDDATLKLLIEKRSEPNKGEDQKFFRLHPPRGGFERKGTKKPFNLGGAVGYRGDKINDLIKRMI
ncbi:50S ribosomal protein L30 [Candidatus Woesearchaeota archaeon]|nr:50S ribosomal protein L30 [Candidatus Woesearchaeota archaeon]MBT6520298.1 50S ribosomal protein L30 [Candidatus Woesearchaeota archaeon]MBT7368250.1 50S ribosomal protein L30 [Candidatus Woesearchaeota archaeon]